MPYPLEDIKFTVPRLYPTPPQFILHSPTLVQPREMLDIGILLPPNVVPRAMFEATSGILTVSLRTTKFITLGMYQETAKYTIEVPSKWLFWPPTVDGHSDASGNEDHVDHDASSAATPATATAPLTTNIDIVGGQFSPWKVEHTKLTKHHKSIVGVEFDSLFRVVFFGKKVDIAETLEKKLALTSRDDDQAQKVSSPSMPPLISPISPISPMLLDLPMLERCGSRNSTSKFSVE